MAYVIINKGRYIGNDPGNTGNTFVHCLQNAKLYRTKEEALRDKCGDEFIQEVHI
jgi:hypothetical protein